MTLSKSYLVSPQGLLEIIATAKGISAITFVDARSTDSVSSSELTETAKTQLAAYFNGTLTQFDLPFDAKGTDFQHAVWKALCDIPYGETASYADIANKLNNPKAVRAVGMANGRNPIAIVVPCHRVIGSNKTLTGYAGGLERKQYLLKLERAQGVLWA
ncbi:methylated-DNA--[protein]-cysteine S-methyltransferase [Alteromonas sp. 1_MG-2023]|uniref:methylated-DNA--[protein]-cysteine S-methyltransferase n=1 Tax=Alteromonas sp. 1_MG-2023 TaxID=3062669 RepID=UPI0026E30A84|nr:methylated-DNA--[protein]-cysteine S-methyltransferase [Alteromonas sp. 1_MG-2023]MDO6566942.1 methylated-DNA--[protein]-cysteine S-methyltransferase [Alteromonas sp. 1_MG-2023]